MEVSRDISKFARSRPVIECAQCGERIYIPEWSECVDGSRVRHLWQCDACGTSFETTVRFAAYDHKSCPSCSGRMHFLLQAGIVGAARRFHGILRRHSVGYSAGHD